MKKAIFPCAIVLGLMLACAPRLGPGDKKFDSSQWKRSDFIERTAYVNDILASRMLIGKRGREIIKILGTPDLSYEKEKTFQYRLKYGAGTAPFDHILSINMNNNDRVKSVRLRE